MMTPLNFEQRYQAEWDELEALIADVRRIKRKPSADLAGERLAELYRHACEHLALARARAYPAHLTERLDQLTADAHQAMYQQSELGVVKLKNLLLYKIPRAVRAHSPYVWIAAALFWVPTLVLGFLVYFRPELILSVVDAQTAASFEQMYSPTAESIGRTRQADTDWAMFGFYILNNVSIGFICFAGGLFVALPTLFSLIFNGAHGGAIAGYLTERGLSTTFYSFVVTHGAFELTAIVLAGAAGLRLGHAVLMPGRRTRVQALVVAARESIVVMYCATGMLLIAAAIEAFWSSAQWIPLVVKYSVAALCWVAVIGYLTLQGRRAS